MKDKKELLRRLKEEKFYPFDGKGIILLGYRGSISHGTYIQGRTDDVDVLGVYIPPPAYILGLRVPKSISRASIDKEIDFVIHPFRKFVHMLSGSNPNVLGLLWLKNEHYLMSSYLGRKLIKNRDIFLSKRYCHDAFKGYAKGQLTRMCKTEFQGYMGQKRKELVRKYGYDIKQGAHLIRLLIMGIEILTTRKVNVFREHDAAMYISIKSGEWSLKRVREKATELFEKLDDAEGKSTLPLVPDKDEINKLCIEIIKSYYGRRFWHNLFK